MEAESRGSEQLVLEGILSQCAKIRIPWDGRSPRDLTRVRFSPIFKAQAEKSVSDFVSDENQFDLWLPMEKAPWIYQGAPLLKGSTRGGI